MKEDKQKQKEDKNVDKQIPGYVRFIIAGLSG